MANVMNFDQSSTMILHLLIFYIWRSQVKGAIIRLWLLLKFLKMFCDDPNNGSVMWIKKWNFKQYFIPNDMVSLLTGHWGSVIFDKFSEKLLSHSLMLNLLVDLQHLYSMCIFNYVLPGLRPNTSSPSTTPPCGILKLLLSLMAS